MVKMDHSPEYSWDFSIGQVDISGVSGGCSGVLVHNHSSPFGATNMLFAVSLLQPSYSDTKVKSSFESEF